jgi:hypothetical protein
MVIGKWFFGWTEVTGPCPIDVMSGHWGKRLCALFEWIAVLETDSRACLTNAPTPNKEPSRYPIPGAPFDEPVGDHGVYMDFPKQPARTCGECENSFSSSDLKAGYVHCSKRTMNMLTGDTCKNWKPKGAGL